MYNSISINTLNELAETFKQRVPRAKLVSFEIEDSKMFITGSSIDETNVDFTLFNNYKAEIVRTLHDMVLGDVVTKTKKVNIDNPNSITYK